MLLMSCGMGVSSSRIGTNRHGSFFIHLSNAASISVLTQRDLDAPWDQARAKMSKPARPSSTAAGIESPGLTVHSSNHTFAPVAVKAAASFRQYLASAELYDMKTL